MICESNGTKFWFHSFHLKNSGILQMRLDQRGDPMKMNLAIFKYKNECQKQSELKKKIKKWGHLSSFPLSFLSYDP